MSEWKQTEYGLMSGHLQVENLGNLCLKSGIITGPFGSQLHKSDYVIRGTPIITVEHLIDNRISRNNLPRVSSADRDRLSKYVLEVGDIVVSRVGSVDRRAMVREDEAGWMFSGRCLRVRVDKSRIYPEYLSWFLGCDGYKDFIRRIAVGATMPSLNTELLKGINVYFPPLHEQKAIAHILGTLDDKIDQLRKTNSVLEDMASALFKSWFVDFDPVKAKQENRPTGLPKDLDDLFPDSFEDSALGPIPTGWRVGRLRDYVRISKGVSYKSSELAPSNTALVTLKSFHRGGGYRADGVKSYTGKFKPDQQVLSDDLVVAYTDVTQDALVIGKPARVIADSEYSTLVASCDVGIVRPVSEVFTTAYLYELFLTSDFQNHIYGHSSGTTVLHLSATGVQSYETHIAPEQLMTQFSVVANDAFAKKKSNIHQIRILTNLRDTLLPKLISGDLRVPEAEQMVAELGL